MANVAERLHLAPPGPSVDAVRPIERVCYLVGAALIVSGLVHLGVAAVDGRPWFGPLSWRKPVTFGVSFGITLIAITWVTTYLRLSTRARTVLLSVLAIDCIVEVVGITVQAWRHVPSHLNNETPFDAGIAYSLAAGGAVLIIVLGSFAIVALRGDVDGPPSMQLAIRAGFALLLAALASGVAMIVRGEVLINAGQRSAAYDSAGFLKWFHAVTLHGVVVLPLLAWWLSRTDRSDDEALRIVRMASIGYVFAAVAALLVSLMSL
jgi:hypothetical protein